MADEAPLVPAVDPAPAPAPEVTPAAPAPEATDTIAAPAPAPAPEPTAEEKAAALAAADAKKVSPYQKRINELKWREEQANREKAAAIAELAAYKARAEANGDGPEPSLTDPLPERTAPAPTDYADAVKSEAARIVAQEKFQANAKKWLDAGSADFKDFNDRCNTVAALGAQDRPEFMQLVTDPEIVPDGHKVVAALADHPEEAMRIFALPPVQMAAAITKFAIAQGKPTGPAISSAPAPIKTIDGTARATEDLSDEKPSAEWFAIRERQRAARQGNGRSF